MDRAEAVRNGLTFHRTHPTISIIGFHGGAVLGSFSPALCALELFRQFRCSDRGLSNRDAEIPVFPLLAFLPIEGEINSRPLPLA